MALEIQAEGHNECEEKEDEVDLEGGLISALEEIDRLKQKNKKQKEILLKYVKDESNLEEVIQ